MHTVLIIASFGRAAGTYCLSEENLANMLSQLTSDLGNIREAAIVSTCNRTELYCALRDDNTRGISEWLSTTRPVNVAELEGASYVHWDKDAASI